VNLRLHWIREPDGAVRPVDTLTWAKWYETADRRIARDVVFGVEVNTVFLGLDHQMGFGVRPEDIGRPVLWETMVFRQVNKENRFGRIDRRGVHMFRYASEADALCVHRQVVDELRAGRSIRNFEPTLPPR